MSTSALPPRPSTFPAGRPRILLVDDDDQAVRLLAHLLGQDYEITIANDGAEGLACARAAHFDLIVTDVGMPHLDGFSMVRELRAAPNAPHVPVIFLTAHTRPAEVVEGIQAGARYYVTKPVKIDDLLGKVHHVLHGAMPPRR